jgi:hypothetical protein
VLESVELSPSEAEALLRSGVTGRVAVSTPQGPHILPVNYSVMDDCVVLRTSPYSLLGTHAHGTTVAFETDVIDHERQRGWSVLVRGRASVITDDDRLEEIRRTWPPRPWASGQRTLHLGIRLDEVTGRQLGRGWDPMREVPVRRVV